MDGQDLGLYGRVLIRHALSLQVIVERAARQLCRFEQGLKRILLPQSSHEPRFFCAAARFCWIKASSFFRYAFSARRYSFSLRSEEHTSELQSLMRNSYAVFIF